MPAPDQPPRTIFATALRALGGNLHTVGDGATAADAIEQVVRDGGCGRTVLYEPCALIEQLGLRLALRARGISLVAVREAGDLASQTEVGLTCAEFAIAQSGTLLVGGEPGGWGLAAALPRIHIALLRDSAIAPDLASVFPRFVGEFSSGRRNWVWISGPSKTADIALRMVTGVHGPNALEVLVLEDDAGGRA